jgi:hypothetical protein
MRAACAVRLTGLRLDAALGVLAGFALVVALTFGHEQMTALHIAFGLLMVWAGVLAWRLRPPAQDAE